MRSRNAMSLVTALSAVFFIGCGDSHEGPCGDGVLHFEEQCDDGNLDDGDGCSATCVIEFCGDGILQSSSETCDDGNNMDGDGCAGNCGSDESCGNGVLDSAAGEACDDGNATDGDGCQANCALPSCGDGVLDAGEVCDDGNTAGGDGCSATCMSDETCANGVVDTAAGESCDDGNVIDGDGCSAGCALEYCGNNVLDPGEACDDGNTTDGDGCSAACTSDESCGNGILDGVTGEACDDGNTADGDGCQANCALPSCGDGVLDASEVCDDGNTADGDGCSATCMSDESCGNGILDGVTGEACDDGNTADGDGCSASCGFECPTGQTDCNGNCVDTDHDPDFCGDCNTVCAMNEACVLGSCQPLAGNPTLYFSEDNNGSGLYTLDLATGLATNIGTSGVTSATVGLAYDPTLELLYGSRYATLLHIQPDGSGAIDVGGIGTEALAYDHISGILYGAINGSFMSMNPVDGSQLMSLTGPGFDAEGLAFNPNDGRIYGIGNGPNLVAYDPGAGTWSTIGDTGLDWDNGGLAYDPVANVLYACGGTQGNNLYRIDPATAVPTLIGDSGVFLRGGLAFAP